MIIIDNDNEFVSSEGIDRYHGQKYKKQQNTIIIIKQ